MQPIKDRGQATRRVKQLSKTIKRRRTYAENLRRSAAAEKVDGDPLRCILGDMLDVVADRELADARREEEEVRVLNEFLQPSTTDGRYLGYGPGYTAEDAAALAERHAQIMKRLDGRLSSDRVTHLANHLGVATDLAAVETALGLDRGALLYLKRVEAAEVAAFGSVRFD